MAKEKIGLFKRYPKITTGLVWAGMIGAFVGAYQIDKSTYPRAKCFVQETILDKKIGYECSSQYLNKLSKKGLDDRL